MYYQIEPADKSLEINLIAINFNSGQSYEKKFCNIKRKIL